MINYEFSHKGTKIKYSDIRQEIIRRINFEMRQAIDKAIIDVTSSFYGTKKEKILENLNRYRIDWVKNKT